MGVYTAGFAGCMVILQATLILLNRPSSRWTFNLVRHQPAEGIADNHSYYKQLLPNGDDNNNNNNTSINAAAAAFLIAQQSPFAKCVDAAKPEDGDPLKLCESWVHRSQIVETVLDRFNPHIIILSIACIHFIICFSRAQKKDNGSQYSLEPLVGAMRWAFGGISMLMLIVCIINGVSDADLLRYPTIIFVLVIFLTGLNYVMAFPFVKDDIAWNINMHLELVSVPLSVIATSAMGVRMWTDMLLYTLFMCVAVNMLWLQQPNGVSTVANQISRLTAVALPTICTGIIQQNWGDNSWQIVVALMATIGILPVYIFTVAGAVDATQPTAAYERFLLRVVHLFTSGALLATIVNFAML